MQFFMLVGGDRFAGYVGVTDKDSEAFLSLTPLLSSDWIPTLQEYAGDPPVGPKRKGDFHCSGSALIFSSRAIGVLNAELVRSGTWSPVRIEDRDDAFFRYWITREVDCLDQERSEIVRLAQIPGNIGMILKPVIDVSRWDGSHIFRVPGDPNHIPFVSEVFVELCKRNKIKGAEFVRWNFDPSPVRT